MISAVSYAVRTLLVSPSRPPAWLTDVRRADDSSRGLRSAAILGVRERTSYFGLCGGELHGNGDDGDPADSSGIPQYEDKCDIKTHFTVMLTFRCISSQYIFRISVSGVSRTTWGYKISGRHDWS